MEKFAGQWCCKPVIPALWEAEAVWYLSSRPAWSIEWFPGHPGLYRETLSRKNQKLKKLKMENCDGPWWHTPLVLALGRWKQADICELKASLQSEFQDSQSCTEKPCLETPKIEVYSEDEWDMSPGPSFLMVIFMTIDTFLAVYSKEMEVLLPWM